MSLKQKLSREEAGRIQRALVTVVAMVALIGLAGCSQEAPQMVIEKETRSPFFVVGGSDARWFQAKDFAPNVYTITAIQLGNTEEFKGFHGVNERIRVDEYAKTIGFFYQIFGNLEQLKASQ